jgi:L-lactate dehydrogenase complex protein LldF
MDNGRHTLINGEFKDMLRCMRCGACLNICPVYRHITGHGYGSIYPGPMGIVLTAGLEGYDNIDSMAYACTLCGACAEHCPMGIPLHDLIRQHRMNMVEQHKKEDARAVGQIDCSHVHAVVPLGLAVQAADGNQNLC